MVVVTPKRVLSSLAPVVDPRGFTRHLLRQLAELLPLLRFHQQVDVIARQTVVQQGHFKLPQRLRQSPPVGISVPGKPQQVLPVVAAVHQVEDFSLDPQAVGTRHAQ
jgi:hypothetical protein